MANSFIKPWYIHWLPWIPFNFWFTEKFYQRVRIIRKESGIVLITTKLGPLRIEVPKRIYKLLHERGEIAVCYQQSRWGGVLKGKVVHLWN